MAVIENRLTEIGDTILIVGEVPIMGILNLLSYVDDVDNVTATRFFEKVFRYSIDGLTYSSWLELTDANLVAIVIIPEDTFFIEYKYTRSGTDTSGELLFNSVTVDGEFVTPVVGETLNKSIFGELLTLPNTDAIKWSINVLQKTYGV